MSTIIQIDNLSKLYRLGTIGSGTFQNDLKRWWKMFNKQGNQIQESDEINTQNNLKKSDLTWALKDINLKVNEGDILGIIGKNGAGKSTLLKILSRITSPTNGTVKIKGKIASLLEIGTGFHPELTGRENIYLNGAILGMTKREIDHKLDEIIDFSGIEKYIDTPVKRYSSGMYVRLAFSVGAHLNPEILLIDEVLAVGDFRFQRRCLEQIMKLNKMGKTTLFVSHHLPSVQEICNRGICFHNGKIKFEGNIRDVIKDYLTMESIQSNNLELRSYKKMKNAQLLDIYTNDIKRTNEQYLIVMNGQKIVIQIRIDAFISIKPIMISLGINDQLDSRICVFHSELSGDHLEMKKGVNEYCCEIKKFPLVEGIYSIDIKLYDNHGDTILFEKNSVTLSVQNGNYFGRGVVPEKEWSGKLFIDHSWKHY